MRHVMRATLLAVMLVSFLGAALATATQVPGFPPIPDYMAVQPDLVYRQVSGSELRLDAFVPVAAGPHAGIIWAHGGGWTSGTKHLSEMGTWPLVGPLVRNGVAIFAIQYRLAPQHRHPAQVDDIRYAVRWVRANAARFRVDPDQLALGGASAGGHLAGLVALTPCPGDAAAADPVERADCRVRALVTIAGHADLREMGWVTGIQALLGSRLQTEGTRALAEISPILYVSASAPPTLMFHGTQDELVPITQSEALEAALRQAGVPARLVRIPGARHGDIPGWDRLTGVPDWRGELGSWMQTHVERR